MAPASVPQEPEWSSAVVVRSDTALAGELASRWEAASGVRSVGILDLLAPRRAFWRNVAGPVALPPDRRARMDAGYRLHRSLERLLPPGAKLEVRVRRDGIAARIDAITDRPIELKTTRFASSGEDLLVERPEHLEQLAMYCALLGRPVGRLITLATEGPEIRTTDLEFRNLDPIARDMRRRAEGLRAALAVGDPAGLPRCRWFERGCEFRSASVCGCTGSEADERGAFAAEVSDLRPRPDEDLRLRPLLSEVVRVGAPPSIARFRELIYPRRAFYDRRESAEEERAAVPPAPSAFAPTGSYDRLLESIEGGEAGEVARLRSLSEEPEEEVAGFRDLPYLARTSRAPTAPRVEEVVASNPQYALELAFRCVATGTTGGRAIIAYERASDPPERLRVFEFEFAPVTVFSRLWRLRAAALERALAVGTSHDLPPCPDWMFARCPYRDECGCGAAVGRSQR